MNRILVLVTGAAAILLCFGAPEQPEPQQRQYTHKHTHTHVYEEVIPPGSETPVREDILLDEDPEPSPAEEYDPVREDIPLDEETQRLLYEVAGETGVSYELALSVIKKETDFRNITGDGGDSIGYMQVQPRWHGDRMKRLGVTDLSDPYGNFLVGCDYLAELIGKGRGLEWALMAYNGGPSYANKLAKAGKVSQYAKDVLDYMNKLHMEESKNGKLDF